MFCKDSKVYGYQYFGFFCQNEELICNGSVVPFGQKVPPSLLPNCTIMNKPCTASDLTSNICYNYSVYNKNLTFLNNFFYRFNV